MALIAHLSDPHLDGGQSRAERLAAVRETVGALAGVDAAVVTGDLADTGAAPAFALHTITAHHLSTTFHHLAPSARW